MKIRLIVIGKTNAPYLKNGESDYEDRLKHYCKFQELLIPQIANKKNITRNFVLMKRKMMMFIELNLQSILMIIVLRFSLKNMKVKLITIFQKSKEFIKMK